MSPRVGVTLSGRYRLQRLIATGADNDAVLQLTGTYHNLLRQWAES